MSEYELQCVKQAPSRTAKQLETNYIRCCICLTREQELFATCNGFGHLSSVNSYSLTISTCAQNRHLKDGHNVRSTDENVSTNSVSANIQASITQYTVGASKLQPANTRYELNRDLTVWCALELMPFEYVESVGTKFFQKKFSQHAAILSSDTARSRF